MRNIGIRNGARLEVVLYAYINYVNQLYLKPILR